jgi:hypothetical protein
MYLSVSPGLRSVLKGQGLTDKLEDKVVVPDVFGFLNVNHAQLKVLPNANKEPEQILMLGFTDDIGEQELVAKLSVYVLPEKNHKTQRPRWSSPAQVDADILALASKIDLKLIPNQRSYSNVYNFASSEKFVGSFWYR